ncbi:MAG: exodeoxyribonuclease III [Clostridiales bacterium]
MKITTLLSWNINGLRAAAKKGFTEKIAQLSPDIICLQEIKAKIEQLPPEIADLEGYHSYFFPAQRPGYSGVAVYSRQEPLSVHYGFGESRFDDEGRVLLLDFPGFRLLNAYFPNGSGSPERLQYKMDFCYAILEYCHQYEEKEQRPLIICGDVNTAHQEIDLSRPKENSKSSGFLPMERAWVDDFIQGGYLDTFRLFHSEPKRYSWWDMKTRARDRNIGWRIDYFFASKSLQTKLANADILEEVIGSDHCPIILEIND